MNATDQATYLQGVLQRLEACPPLTEVETSRLDSTDAVTSDEVQRASPEQVALARDVPGMALLAVEAPHLHRLILAVSDPLRSAPDEEARAAQQAVVAASRLLGVVLRILTRIFAAPPSGLGVPPAALQPRRGLLPRPCMRAVKEMYAFISLAVDSHPQNGRVVAKHQAFLACHCET